MGLIKVPDHRRPPLVLGQKSSGSTASLSLSRTTLFYTIILCLALLLLPLFASAEPLPYQLDVLEGQVAFDVSSTNAIWEAGGYTDVVIRVHLGSDTSSSQRDGADRLSPDDLNMLLIPFRAKAKFWLSPETDLALITHESRGEDVALRYRWPVPLCLPSGRHTLQLQTRRSSRRQSINIPILVVVPDERARMMCSSGLQAHLQLKNKRSSSSLSARDPDAADGEAEATTSTEGGTPLTISPSSLPATTGVEPTDAHYSSYYNYTSSGAYSESYPYSGSYTTPAPTSYTNTASVSVVTTTAIRTSVQTSTVTSVSTDLKTIVSTATGSDTTEVFTTTQTSISTIVVATTTAGGFLPVNGASPRAALPMSALAVACLSSVFWLLCSANCCVA
ncbi:uncharacterized protein B0H18DRAFT_971251 [Fomitopsis serialis]|uniref:uncharacterized protein n=1 Tax=Fomitopsis serialis TaxID=139415 RepID=UPI00200874BD|nr:uncharacterized protein B0H18DRAFT_971251 [Neoantrodia serialis]KAH9937568.1 hypothetical protein B0H18DRAFT_971251 [Neoantrodia serialis]